MNPSADLSLEGNKPCSFSFLFKSSAVGGGGGSVESHKIEDFLNRLEEERLKIDAFKRELPLCMQLLNDAMEAFRQELSAACPMNPKPVLEEFIPLKHSEVSEIITNSVETNSTARTEKPNWMTTAQIWGQTNNNNNKNNEGISKSQLGGSGAESENGLTASPKPLDAKQRGGGGAFLPFSKERNGVTQALRSTSLPELALSSGDKGLGEVKRPEPLELVVPISRMKAHESSNQSNCVSGGGSATNDHKSGAGNDQGQIQTASQIHRKPRRCWSPDLHRRFVNALQQLGGSQVATPKQIRELMKVDGLTNDEVKSHLQKYRLHTRRPSPTPQAMTAPAPQLVVLGGIWVPPEYTAAAHTGTPGIYSATIAAATPAATQPLPPPLLPTTHFCHPSSLPPEFRPPPPHHQFRHVYCEQQLTTTDNNKSNNNNSSSSNDHNNKASSTSRSLGPSAGERSQSMEEDGKSDSGSWKRESGDINDSGSAVRAEMGRALSLSRKGALVRHDSDEDEGEESTGSDITLKF